MKLEGESLIAVVIIALVFAVKYVPWLIPLLLAGAAIWYIRNRKK